MALTWREKNELEELILNHARNHVGEVVTVKTIRPFLGATYASVPAITITSIIRNSTYYSKCDEKVGGCVAYEIGKGRFYIVNIEKVRNTLVMTNEDGDSLVYDFNTNEIADYNGYSHTLDYNRSTAENGLPISLIVRHINRRVGMTEWIFNYPTLLSGSLNIVFDCPKGYIKWCTDNRKYITKESYNEFLIMSKYGDIDRKVVSLIRSIECCSNDLSLEDVLKYHKGLAYALEHEYVEDFFRGDNGWGSSLQNQVATFFANYLLNCKFLGDEPIWKNVLKNATIAKRLVVIKKHSAEVEKVATYQNSKALKFENDLFEVIVPTTYEEFKNEADYQQNCVCAYYYPKVVDEATHVVFIRKKSDPTTPYITCEITNSGTIKQYLTRFNEYVRDEKALLFQGEYRNYLASIF